MTTVLWFLVGGTVAAALWHAWGSASSRVEQMRYTVLQKRDGYEVREYAARIVAQTSVDGPYRAALTEGFRIVARYIFGGNLSRKSIAMTAPVLEEPASEKIEMTAPIMEHGTGNAHVISFGMPASYTLETLPKPIDPRVKLVKLPSEKMAAYRLSGYASAARIARAKEKLLALLERDGVSVSGTPAYAGYNAPWTPPWLVRNEVLVSVA